MAVKIILASGSPRRREILDQVGIQYTCIPSNKEEIVNTNNPEELVRGLSAMKAEDVEKRLEGYYVVIGADTVVAHNSKILGKPKNRAHAVEMIESLQNNVHQVHTGVTIIVNDENGRRSSTFAVSTEVHVARMSTQQIKNYVDSGEPMDKAGAYAIQGKFAPYISQIRGDYYNIVGFPIAAICREAEKLGINLI